MSFNLIKETDNWMCRKHFGLPRLNSFYPSEANVTWLDSYGIKRVSGQCLRSSWYRLTGQKVSESHDAYTQWIFALGKAVEEVLVEQWKQMGIWVDNNVKFYDEVRNISGELDVVIRNPLTNQLICCECKSFAGYQATKHIMGNKSIKGKPKDNHLMQALIYTDLCNQLELIEYTKLVYYARDSGNRREFNITLVDDNNTQRPTIDGVVDYRFTMQDIYDRYNELRQYVQTKQTPPRDYELVWDKEKVTQRYKIGEVAKTTYEKWQSSPSKYPVGDWECKLCSYKTVCYSNQS
jgi:CRISPR/Cas system-associated exonuclease Cas4 (RecB family)